MKCCITHTIPFITKDYTLNKKKQLRFMGRIGYIITLMVISLKTRLKEKKGKQVFERGEHDMVVCK